MTLSEITAQLTFAKAANVPLFQSQILMRQLGVSLKNEEAAIQSVYGFAPKSIQQKKVEMAERIVLRQLINSI